MLKTVKRIYLPRWQRWFMVPFFVGMWVFITYMEWFNPDNTEKMGVVGYVFMSALMLGLGAMMYLMTSGKLPAYIMEEETKDK